MRLRTFVAIVAVVVLGWPGVAHAKGPTEATIEGDSLSAPVLIAGEEGGTGDFWTLVDQAGYFPAAFGQSPDPMLDEAPTTNLGPAFLITWRMPFENGAMDVLHQTLYPYAEGGPLTYTEAGQPFFGDQHARGGWFRANKGLPYTLVRLGVAAPPGFSPATPAAAPPPTTVQPVSTPAKPAPADGGSTLWPGVGIVAMVGAAAATGALVLARRRIRVSPA